MDTEQIVVLTISAIAVAPLIWIERRSRRNRKAQSNAETRVNVAVPPAGEPTRSR